jgi:predicted Fe-Mo cluster-binding NifX family protein
MKVAVSAASGTLEAQVDPRFGRCQYFVFVDTNTMAVEAVQNASAGSMSGAGIQAAQAMAGRGVQAVITGNVGPNAYQVLSSAGIRILTGASGTVREAVEKFKAGQLPEATALGPAGSGMGLGLGRGSRMGMGGGGGTGRFSPTPYSQIPVSPYMQAQPMSREQEVSMLESQMDMLQHQLNLIRKRLEELKGSSQ